MRPNGPGYVPARDEGSQILQSDPSVGYRLMPPGP